MCKYMQQVKSLNILSLSYRSNNIFVFGNTELTDFSDIEQIMRVSAFLSFYTVFRAQNINPLRITQFGIYIFVHS